MPWPSSGKSSGVLGSETVESSPSAHTRFAFKLFREFTHTGGASDIFFSPSSVMSCLTLVHELASGETRESMAKALEISGLDRVAMETEIALLRAAFNSRSEAEISFANAVFLGRLAQIDSQLRAKFTSLYSAELSVLDFSIPDAVETINKWVNTKTKGKIREIVRELSPLTALFALNAVYFKGRWRDPFEKELTRDRPFSNASEAIKQLPMMVQGGRYRY